MPLPVIRGVIDRRLLVNFRVTPEAVSSLLPTPLEPKLVGGTAIAGICLIRLREIRPRFVPRFLGIASENAAHRVAVQWPPSSEGVFIPRRDTSSRLNMLAGGRLFPGVHHLAKFSVVETTSDYSIDIRSPSGASILSVRASVASSLPSNSVFSSLAEASAFFQAGSIGYSPSRRPGRLDGLELRTDNWAIEPLSMLHVDSSFFDDTRRFPAGTVEFDSAFVMRQIQHQWHTQAPLSCGPSCRDA